MTESTPATVWDHRLRQLDEIVGWTLFALLVVAGLHASVLAFLLPLGLDACHPGDCTATSTELALGWAVAMLGHWVVIGAALFVLIARARRRRVLWWVPVAAGGVGVATAAAGWHGAFHGLPGIFHGLPVFYLFPGLALWLA